MIESLIGTFQMINSIAALAMVVVGFYSLAKAAGATIKMMAGHETTMEAGQHVRRWGRNLAKKDEKIWSYNKIANKLVVDMKRGDDDIERRLKRIKESLEQLESIDKNPNLVPEGGLIQ